MIQKNKYCTACGACVQKCPKGCISLKENEDGFMYPEINNEKCIECDLCQKVCPILQGNELNIKDQKAYAFVEKDNDLLMNATSGGAFGAIARYVLKHDGIVYGSAYEQFPIVKHIRIDNFNDLRRLNGSKYVQSNTADTFIQAERDLKNNKLILYSGTPCQIAGLKKYLGSDYENLITIDIICHGVPSQAYFNKFVYGLSDEEKINISEISFRSKKNSQGSYSGVYSGTFLKNNKKFNKKFNYFDHYYYFYFLHGLTYRQSCYLCEYANRNRVGDFTIGDFWGSEAENISFETRKGCSLVLLNSKKAKSLFEKIDAYKQEVDIENAIRCNKQLQEPTKKKEDGLRILKEYSSSDYKVMQKRFARQYKKSIIIGKIKYKIPNGIKKLLLRAKYKKQK